MRLKGQKRPLQKPTSALNRRFDNSCWPMQSSFPHTPGGAFLCMQSFWSLKR